MATKSITKNIVIKGNTQCRKIVNAFEKAEQMHSAKKLDAVVLKRSCNALTREDMHNLFGKE